MAKYTLLDDGQNTLCCIFSQKIFVFIFDQNICWIGYMVKIYLKVRCKFSQNAPCCTLVKMLFGAYKVKHFVKIIFVAYLVKVQCVA